MHCNEGWLEGNDVSRNRVGDEGVEVGAQTKRVFANNSIDSCTQALS